MWCALPLRAQQAAVLSVDAAGTVRWSNCVPGHAYTIRVAAAVTGGWSLAASNIRPTNGLWSAGIGATGSLSRFVSVVDTGRYVHIAAPVNIGSVSGDSGALQIVRTGTGDGFFQFTVSENDNGVGSVPLSFLVTLSSPPGADYDLYLYYLGSVVDQSTQAGTTLDSIYESFSDTFGADDTRSYIIEVRRFTGTSFAPWTLTISGNPSS